MSQIRFSKGVNECDYHDSSNKNPHLVGMSKARSAIGLNDQAKWNEEWRPIMTNFIRTSGLLDINLSLNKARALQEFQAKVRELIALVRDDSGSDVPDPFLEKALYIIMKDLRNQVIAHDKVKQESLERSPRPRSHPALTPAPASTPGPFSSHQTIAAVLSGRTSIALRRVNKNGFIRTRRAFWHNLAVFPPSFPPPEQLPEISDWKISVVHQLLAHYELWHEKERIYWLDPDGSPFELSSDADLHHIVFAAQNPQERVIAREILVQGSDNEEVQFPWSSDPSGGKVLVRNPVDVQPSLSLKRPGGVVLGGIEDPVDDSKKKRSRHSQQPVGPPSIAGHSSKLSHRPREDVETRSAAQEDPPGGLTSHLGRGPGSEHSLVEMNDAAKALLDAAKYDREDYTAAAAHVIETEACAQMGERDINWDHACALVKADKTRKGPDDEVPVQGLSLKMKPHQIVAAYWMMLSESRGCAGGMESDEMGYGKTVTCILRSYLNNCLVQANESIRAFRRGDTGAHIRPHLHNDQTENAVCPSQDFWPIQCPCQQWSVSRRLKPRYGVNLALLPVALIQTWLREIKKMFDKQPKTRFLLQVKIAWGAAEKNRRLKQYVLTEDDKQALLVNDNWLVTAKQSSLFLLTSQHQATFSKVQLQKEWTWENMDQNKEPPFWSREYPAVCFGSIYVDEAHRLRKPTNPVMTFLREVNSWFVQRPVHGEGELSVPPRKPRYVPVKWFITGTPWERSPDDFAAALQTIEVADWSNPSSPYYSLRHENIVELAKEHESHLKKALKAEEDPDSSHGIQIIDKIRSIIQLFMIRRTDESYINGYKVVRLPQCTVEWAEFTTPTSLAARIDGYRKQVSKAEREAYLKAIKKWKKANLHKPIQKRDRQPEAPLDHNRRTAPSYRLRILADFPGLIDHLFDDKGGQLSSAFTIADLDERNAVFKHALPSILAASPKYQAIVKLLNGSWPTDPVDNASLMKPTDKLVVITCFPMSAWLIAQGLSAAGFKARLIKGDMAVEERDLWQDLFQEDPDILPNLRETHPKHEIPRILVATSNLCSLGLTLHKAHHLVKFDVDFLDGADRQALKRIWRIGQKERSFVWRYITTDNTEECLVRRRQELRAGIMKEAFKLPTNDYNFKVSDEDLNKEELDESLYA